MPIYKNPRLKRLIKYGKDIMYYDEFHELWTHTKGSDNKVLLTLLYFTGARPIEFKALTVANFRIDNNRNRIYVSIPTAKKKRLQYRIIPLSLKYPEVQQLKAYIEGLRSLHPLHYLFPVALTNDIRHWIRHKLKKAGVDYPPYFFRHNFASILYTKGVELRKIAAMRGTSEKVTEQVYSHFAPMAYDEVADMF